jgi:hypothetical protein
MESPNGVNSPMEPSKHLSEANCLQTEEERKLIDHEPYKDYQEIISKLMYLVMCTRSNLVFAT